MHFSHITDVQTKLSCDTYTQSEILQKLNVLMTSKQNQRLKEKFYNYLHTESYIYGLSVVSYLI